MQNGEPSFVPVIHYTVQSPHKVRQESETGDGNCQRHF